MSEARSNVFASIRRSLEVTGQEEPRQLTVRSRLSSHLHNIDSRLASVEREELRHRFADGVTAAKGSVEKITRVADVPAAISAFLRNHNLPMTIRRGSDLRWEAFPWDREPALEVLHGAAAPDDLCGVSYAFVAAAETGTVMLVSGMDNPTTLNFLPENHIVIVDEEAVFASYEDLWVKLRDRFDKASMPRAVNFVTGPSRSGDIEQVLVLGAHGPRRLHVIMITGRPTTAER